MSLFEAYLARHPLSREQRQSMIATVEQMKADSLMEQPMTEFADALNKQQQDEMAVMAGVGATERVDALEKRMAKLEALLASLKEPFVMLPEAPATNPDPAA